MGALLLNKEAYNMVSTIFPKGVIFTFDLVFAFLFLCHKILANRLLTSLQLSFCAGQLFEKNFGPFFLPTSTKVSPLPT
jgi:hypothetical protein